MVETENSRIGDRFRNETPAGYIEYSERATGRRETFLSSLTEEQRQQYAAPALSGGELSEQRKQFFQSLTDDQKREYVEILKDQRYLKENAPQPDAILYERGLRLAEERARDLERVNLELERFEPSVRDLPQAPGVHTHGSGAGRGSHRGEGGSGNQLLDFLKMIIGYLFGGERETDHPGRERELIASAGAFARGEGDESQGRPGANVAAARELFASLDPTLLETLTRTRSDAQSAPLSTPAGDRTIIQGQER